MSTFDNDADYVAAPKDDAEFHKLYYPFFVNSAAKKGFTENDREDVASEMLLRHLERNSREEFDPDRSFEFQGKLHPARFKTFIGRNIELTMRGHRDKIARHTRREVPIGTFGVKDQSAKDSWQAMVDDVQEDHADAVHDMIDEAAEADMVRRLLARIPPRNAHDRCNLVDVFDAVRAQVVAYGEYDIPKLAEFFGVAITTMHSWMWWFKANYATIYGRPVPPKRAHRTRRNPA